MGVMTSDMVMQFFGLVAQLMSETQGRMAKVEGVEVDKHL